MMGTKTLREIDEELRQAYANSPINPVRLVDKHIRQHQKEKKPANPRALKTLIALRDSLARLVEAGPKKRRKRTKTRQSA